MSLVIDTVPLSRWLGCGNEDHIDVVDNNDDDRNERRLSCRHYFENNRGDYTDVVVPPLTVEKINPNLCKLTHYSRGEKYESGGVEKYRCGLARNTRNTDAASLAVHTHTHRGGPRRLHLMCKKVHHHSMGGRSGRCTLESAGNICS